MPAMKLLDQTKNIQYMIFLASDSYPDDSISPKAGLEVGLPLNQGKQSKR